MHCWAGGKAPMGRRAAKSVQDLRGGFCMRPRHWESVEMTRSLHMEQHEFPDADLVSECGVCCIGGNDLTAQNLAGFCILDLELCGVTKF